MSTWRDDYQHQSEAYRRAHQKAHRQISRRDWFANHIPVLGPLAFRFWLWQSRGRTP